MSTQLRFAKSEADYESVWRLRYDIYSDEMGYKFAGADHDGRRLVEPFKRSTQLMIAEADSEVVGTLQFNWGGECGFTGEEMHIYRVADFLPVVGPEGIIIFSRYMTRPDHRTGPLPGAMLDAMYKFALEKGARLLFCDCRPHLINTYLRLGFRTYAKTYNDPIAGILAPLVLVMDDVAHLERMKSRFAPLTKGWQPRADIRARILGMLPQATQVKLLNNPTGSPDWSGIQDTLADDEDGHVSIFQGLEPAEIARLIEMSPVIECMPGDKIISQDVADRTVFVVLEGAVEVHRDGEFVALLPRGSVFGEVAFLLGRERTADVKAATAAKVISLRERALNDLIASESQIAARFLLNLARIVCLKLAEDREVETAAVGGHA
jgi:GNAT superfamily N-acetyltransferase